MGVVYGWFCDERREWFDPSALPYFGDKYDAIPWTAWAVAVLCLTEWSGESVRLLGDSCDEYYTLTVDDEWARRDRSGAAPYTEVSALALRHALDAEAVPDDALRKMARELIGEARAQTAPIEEVTAALREKYPPRW